jgi:hypothetical protein
MNQRHALQVFVGGHFSTAGKGADAVRANNVAMWDPQVRPSLKIPLQGAYINF